VYLFYIYLFISLLTYFLVQSIIWKDFFEMTCYVLSGTLKSAQLIAHLSVVMILAILT